jgi:exonuclease III
MNIKLVSVNIEGQKHLDKVRELIGRENPEVVCLMEVYDSELIGLAGEQYSHYVYAPNNVVREATSGQPRLTLGVAILSKKPIDNHQALYCDGKNEQTINLVGTHSPVALLAKIDQYNIGGSFNGRLKPV